jgi:hypothetical protein
LDFSVDVTAVALVLFINRHREDSHWIFSVDESGDFMAAVLNRTFILMLVEPGGFL